MAEVLDILVVQGLGDAGHVAGVVGAAVGLPLEREYDRAGSSAQRGQIMAEVLDILVV